MVESLNSVGTIKRFGLESFANIKTETRFIGLLNIGYKSALNSVFQSPFIKNEEKQIKEIKKYVKQWKSKNKNLRLIKKGNTFFALYIQHFWNKVPKLLFLNWLF